MRSPDAAQRAAFGAWCAADPGSKWVPALRCIVKNAAPCPGNETGCFALSQDEGDTCLAN
jgi:hypothetical protein